MAYQIHTEERGLLIEIQGVMDNPEMREVNVQIWEHPNWDTNRYQIWDFQACRKLDIDYEDLMFSAKADNAAF